MQRGGLILVRPPAYRRRFEIYDEATDVVFGMNAFV
jgi:hypothetical protein